MSYDLIPAPKALRETAGGFTADSKTVIAVSARGGAAGEFLASAVEEATSFSLDVTRRGDAGRTLWVSRDGAPSGLLERAGRALERLPRSREAYALIVSPRGIGAAAGGDAGLFYAAASASQLLGKKNGRPFWPSCTITDWPDLAFRGVHLDLKHHMEKFEYIEGLVPRLAALKINAIVLELEDKFVYSRRSEIAAPVGFSPDDLKRFVALCRKYHVEFIPLVQGLGHASYILKHPRYAALREKRGNFAEFCPQAAGTYEVLFDLYDEVAGATEGTKYFHIGGDEAWLVGSCPRCAKEMKKTGKFGLFMKWLEPCVEKIRSLGRVPMVWDDMLVKHAGEDYSTLPKDLFYVRWNYRPNAAELCADMIGRYSRSGLRVILAAATQTGHPYLPNYPRHFANIDGFGKAAAAGKLAGILTTTWEDSGNHTETFWPGFAATGQAGWNPAVDIDAEFLMRFTRLFHGAADGRLAAAYRTLGAAGLECYQLFTPNEPYDCEEMYPVPALAPAPAGRRWRDLHAERIQSATRLAASLREVRKVLSKEILSGRRANPYALEVLLGAAHPMLSRVGLFFALRDAELEIEAAHGAFAAGARPQAAVLVENAALGIENALADCERALSSLNGVWEKTRLPQDMALFETPGKKYIHDFKNYRHLACKTRDLSYHLFVERRIGARELAARLRRVAQKIPSAQKWPWK